MECRILMFPGLSVKNNISEVGLSHNGRYSSLLFLQHGLNPIALIDSRREDVHSGAVLLPELYIERLTCNNRLDSLYSNVTESTHALLCLEATQQVTGITFLYSITH
ncbi:hypothetical protein BCR33DRAFT_713036 [Rhizoclosmatium globosum]|uniref:Uncharacterized protein n=1 Tax=Rhizoclosmatium globosum TaxID=329046 RepID=A0A1Y2CVS3_9FUNG|nr:hypothetical protein BCR33DRAFT_713036 [Rhizoclosmatium globosum]|eukprot:ORY51123.1 hypothetical protein BCR33DRAFT_713036 [Rhizoclosmatium globosum]